MIYLDNSATTKPFLEVVQEIEKINKNTWGNPSSLYDLGLEAELVLEKSREIIASSLFVKPSEIYFTPNGTYANNMAILGTALAKKARGNHIISSAVEHPATFETLEFLKKQFGFEITYLKPDKNGKISVESLKKAITSRTILVSIMHVNNETGTVFDIENLAKATKEEKSDCLFHTDAIQTYMKTKINLRNSDTDMLSMSAHKIYGPKGVGALYISEKARIHPIIHGGGQEKSVFPGTENVALIAGFAKAVEILYKDIDKNYEHAFMIKEYFLSKVSGNPDIQILATKNDFPYIIGISLPGIRSEIALHFLKANKYIYQVVPLAPKENVAGRLIILVLTMKRWTVS